MSYKLEYPYTEEERLNFIVEKNHQQGLKIEIIDNIVDEQNYPTYYALERNEIMVDGVPTIDPEFEAKEQARLRLIEAQRLLPIKEKEKLDIMANILADIDVEENKERLRTLITEIEELKKPETTKITVSQENQGQMLKGNTTYRITSNAKDISATGNNVSIKFNLRYTRHDNSKTTNPQEDKIITSINWRSAGTAPTSFPIEFKTSNYTDENNLHRIYCLNDGVIIGELSEPIEFYLEEIE